MDADLIRRVRSHQARRWCSLPISYYGINRIPVIIFHSCATPSRDTLRGTECVAAPGWLFALTSSTSGSAESGRGREGHAPSSTSVVPILAACPEFEEGEHVSFFRRMRSGTIRLAARIQIRRALSLCGQTEGEEAPAGRAPGSCCWCIHHRWSRPERDSPGRPRRRRSRSCRRV